MSLRNPDLELEAGLQFDDGCSAPDRRPVVLVVDDEPLVRHLICSVLTRLGCQTLEAADGAEALLVGADATLDLLITDYEMPGMKGTGVADFFRDRMKELPVVLVSATPEAGPLARSRGYRFLAKPFDLDQLAAMVTGVRLGQQAVAGTSKRRGSVERRNSARPLRGHGTFSGWEPRAAFASVAVPVDARICTLGCFPNDAQFAADANRILEECQKTARTWAGVLEQVRIRLVEVHPNAVVSPRHHLAANGDLNEHWYCYRDGRLTTQEHGN